MAIPARNESRALVKSPSLAAPSCLTWKWLHCWNTREDISNCTMSCMSSLLLPHCSQDPPSSPAPSAQSQGFTQDVWTCYTALSTWSTDLTTMASQTGLWQIHISYLPRKDQPESGYICITFPCKLWCVQKRPFKMTGSSPWTALGTCSFHHLQRLLGHSWHSRSGLWCDICSQAERQREKVSLAEVPWEDSSWAEPTVRKAADIYINKSSTCSY